ncbi:MAG: UDP-N-acetylmuramoyl-tripeptide--D-alanyl-D-alanine ligase [Campylobacterota bacterium]|nr:UDP-N-acetylmuramoyl-tripeptide--D-alanyl-D-alanine ligase [Campylobacterota bacterium]
MEYFDIFTHILVVMSLGWYMITNLQWYNYKIERVILKHHKQQWHIVYFATPIIFYYLLPEMIFNVYFYLLYLTSFFFWNKNLDKPLVMTSRVKRFLLILLFVTFSVDALVTASQNSSLGLFLPLFIGYVVSTVLEKIFFINFKNRAKNHLNTYGGLQIVAITASYGKTSIKNYLSQVLSTKFKCYMTPRSINTIAGIVKDVNNDLPRDTEIYIAEAGARQRGDIEEITNFLEPQYAIIGSVGEQHIEYFKTLDNIIHTKMEILRSPRLTHAFVHDSVPILKYDTITKFPNSLNITRSDLNGIWFDIEIDGNTEHFHAPVLGSFNAINLTAVVLMAQKLGMSIDEIKLALHNLQPVEHRLHFTKVGGKLILDDSFNGNIDGMLEAVNIASTYEGRKVIVTPGIVESTMEANVEFIKAVDEVFDMVIVTGSLNSKLFDKVLEKNKAILLEDKSKLQDILAEQTHLGDLILFANDAPNFI